MDKDQILKKHEDANEYHFHELDRAFILEAMQEYAEAYHDEQAKRKDVCKNCGCSKISHSSISQFCPNGFNMYEA